MKLSFYSTVFACVLALPAIAQVEVAPGVLQVGQIQNPDVQESSGIIPAKGKQVYWTHNDSGLDMLYGMTLSGESLGAWKLKDVDLENIEDVAAKGGRIFVADIGNNDTSRETVSVYALPALPVKRSGEVRPIGVWRLKYPGDPFDSESFFVYRNAGYLISKELSKGEVRIYSFPLTGRRSGAIELKKLSKLDVNDEARGADITADGKRLAVITGNGAYLFQLEKRIPADGTLEPALFVPFSDNTMEGCCFTPDGLLVTSEGRNLYLFTDDAFKYPVKRAGARR